MTNLTPHTLQDLILETKKVNLQDIHDLQPLQLKTDYYTEATKKSILELGFASAIYVWQDPKSNKIYCVDGHGRRDILNDLKAEGYKVPEELSCTFLDNTKITTKKEAIKYLLRVFNIKQNPIHKESFIEWVRAEEVEMETLEVKTLNIERNKSEEEKTILVFDFKENFEALGKVKAFISIVMQDNGLENKADALIKIVEEVKVLNNVIDEVKVIE